MYGYNQDNAGNKVPHGVISGQPVPATGQTLDQTSDTEVTVESGSSYLVTACVGYCLLGLLTTATAANIIWVVPQGQTIHIKVPVGTTTLHYKSVGTTPLSFLREML